RRAQRIAFSLAALHTCGFYDDPSDKRRTTTNIEEMCIAYMDKYDWSTSLPIILEDYVGGPTAGIEIPIDITLEYTFATETIKDYPRTQFQFSDDGQPFLRYRFIGRADGIHWKDGTDNVIRTHENKTASRLGDAWEMSHIMSHQHTGYMVGLSA